MSDDLKRLLTAVGAPGLVSVCHRAPEGYFRAAVLDVRRAPAHVKRVAIQSVDVWLSVARVSGPPREGKRRGGEKDIVRLTALPIDLDVKTGGLPSWEAARAMVAELSRILGTTPAAVVNSGHGLQPWFLLDHSDRNWACTGANDPRWTAMRDIVHRWGFLVEAVANSHHGSVDRVFDLARLMRCPDTTNYKSRDAPVPVLVEQWNEGAPLTYSQLADTLDSLGIVEGPRPTTSTLWTPSSALRSESEALEQMSAAKQGQRNDTLVRIAFQSAIWGRMTPAFRAALAEAAVYGGQTLSEVESTLDSATTAASRERRDADAWLSAMRADNTLAIERTRLWLLAAGRQFADLSAAVTRGAPVGMSARELAERLGVTADAGSRHLRKLVELGWLRRCDPGVSTDANGYALSRPDPQSPKSDNHSSARLPVIQGHTGTTGSSSSRGPNVIAVGPADVDVEYMLASPWGDAIRLHPAFLPGDGDRLTLTSMKILAALTVEDLGISTLTKLARTSDTSARRALSQLLLEGLVRRDEASQTYALADPNILALLDAWAEARGVSGRMKQQKLRHAADREKFAKALEEIARQNERFFGCAVFMTPRLPSSRAAIPAHPTPFPGRTEVLDQLMETNRD